jgi:hypothetical protein
MEKGQECRLVGSDGIVINIAHKVNGKAGGSLQADFPLFFADLTFSPFTL